MAGAGGGARDLRQFHDSRVQVLKNLLQAFFLQRTRILVNEFTRPKLKGENGPLQHVQVLLSALAPFTCIQQRFVVKPAPVSRSRFTCQLAPNRREIMAQPAPIRRLASFLAACRPGVDSSTRQQIRASPAPGQAVTGVQTGPSRLPLPILISLILILILICPCPPRFLGVFGSALHAPTPDAFRTRHAGQNVFE